MDLSKLKEPFSPDDLEWRLQSCGEKNGKFWGKALCYITSRAVQERLDEVVGPDNWQTKIEKKDDAYLCSLSIRVTHEDGTSEWITRTDGADATDIEAVKGGISGAIKRVAVQFGIGRYLYNLKDNWAIIDENGQYSGKTKDSKWFNWNPPKLPKWALPNGDTSYRETQKKQSDLVKKVQALIDGKLLDEAFVSKAKWYVDNNDEEGLKRVLSYYEEKEKK